MKNKFTLKSRLNSIGFACTGMLTLLKTQHNAWIHLCATISVVSLALFLKISTYDWCFLIIAITTVWTAEALNTALEFLADVVSPKPNPLIKKAKDIAAAAVFISTIGAILIGILILTPHLS